MSNLVIGGYVLVKAIAASRPITGLPFGGYTTTSDVTVVPHASKSREREVLTHLSPEARIAAESAGVNSATADSEARAEQPTATTKATYVVRRAAVRIGAPYVGRGRNSGA